MKFKELNIGDTFDFIDDANPGWNSFFDRCKKISPRKYISTDKPRTYIIGSVSAAIFHAKRTSEINSPIKVKVVVEMMINAQFDDDVDEIISDMDYHFSYEGEAGKVLKTEIIDVEIQ